MKKCLTIISYIVLVLIEKSYCGVVDQQSINTSFVEVTAFNQRERELLYALHTTSEVYFLNDVTNEAAVPIDIFVDDNELLLRLEKLLVVNDMQYNLVPTDNPLKTSQSEQYEQGAPVLNRFFDYKEILQWVQMQVRNQRNVENKYITETYNKNLMFILRILAQPSKGISVMLIGGEQGRDWLSPAILLNYVNILLEETTYKPLTDKFNFFIMPVMNPDGYIYSMTEGNRFNAKNRKVIFPNKHCNHDKLAIGINIERNMFDMNEVPFNSDSECSSVFLGHKAVSEEETRSLRYILSKIAEKMLLFVNVRGFEKLITIPYAQKSRRCKNHDILMEILSAVTLKMKKKFNITYFYGSTADFIFNVTGNCADWVKSELNVPVVLTVYLKDESTYLPKVSQVAPLTDHFATIINETLSLAYDIYKPLFKDHQESNKGNLTVILTLFVLSFIT